MNTAPGTPNFYLSWSAQFDRPKEADTFDADAGGQDWVGDQPHAGSFAQRPTWPDGQPRQDLSPAQVMAHAEVGLTVMLAAFPATWNIEQTKVLAENDIIDDDRLDDVEDAGYYRNREDGIDWVNLHPGDTTPEDFADRA